MVLGSLPLPVLSPLFVSVRLHGLAIDYPVFGSIGTAGFAAGLLTGLLARQYEVLVAVCSVLVRVALFFTTAYLYTNGSLSTPPPERGVEHTPLLMAMFVFGWPLAHCAPAGGFVARILRMLLPVW